MENKAHALAAGLFVVTLAALLIALAAWLTRETGTRDAYEISTRQSVTGLQEQAPVRLRGVEVGKVESIGFDPQVAGQVLVRLSIDRQAPVTRETFATISFQGVTGLGFLQLDDSGKPAPRLQGGGAAPPRIPLRPGLWEKLQTRGEALVDQLDQLTQQAHVWLGPQNQQRFATALDQLGQAAQGVGQLAGHIDTTWRLRVDPALAAVPGTLHALQNSAEAIGATARRLNEPDGPLDRLAEGTEALSHAADSFNAATLPRINRVTEETSRAVRQLGRAVTSINDNPQSLIFGNGPALPGPGEAGFDAQGARP